MRLDTDHCVRNNLLVVMADVFRMYVELARARAQFGICERQIAARAFFSNSTAVNEHGPAMASCLRDPSILIRKQAVFLITTLIRDEYFKWGGQVRNKKFRCLQLSEYAFFRLCTFIWAPYLIRT